MKSAKFYFADGTVREWVCDDVETFATHIVVRRKKPQSELVAQSIVEYRAVAVISMANLLWWEPL